MKTQLQKKKQPTVTSLKGYTLSEVKLIRSICLDSFYEFVKEFWTEIIQEEPEWNFHIEFQCDEAQYIAEGIIEKRKREHDLVVNVPPGTTKSTIWSVMLPAWCLAKLQSMRVMVCTHTQDLGFDLSTLSRSIVKSEKYRACFPEVKLRKDQDTKGYWKTDKGGFRIAFTVGGKNPMGFHAHLIIVDDPIDPERAISKASLKAANRFVSNTVPSRKLHKMRTVTVLVMQRLHQSDPSATMLKSGNPIRQICLPCDTSFPIKPERLKAKYKNGLLDPKRLPKEAIEEAKRRGEYYFAGQFGQQPVPLGGGSFKVLRLHIDEPPPISDFRKLVRYWDNAGTAGGGAYTVGCLMGEDKMLRLWVLDMVRGQWEANERETIKKDTAKRDGKRVLIVQEQEPGSGGKESAEATARRLKGWRIKLDKVGKSDGNKELRADPYAAQVNAGNVYLARGKHWVEEYIDELRYFPHSTFKDQVDASSGAFAWIVRKGLVIGGLGAGK